MANKEQTWQYNCHFLFNKQTIISFTLTDHWQKKHSELAKEFIAELFLKLAQEERLEPIKYLGKRIPYKWEVTYQNQKYRFIFWFKDQTNNHLWIRNCYPIK